MALLVDTNALLAGVDARDPHHTRVAEYLEGADEPLIVPCTVLPELDYLVSARLGIRAEVASLRAMTTGELTFEHFTEADLDRSIELIERYADGDIGLVDASIVAIAERLGITRILTLDRRHFGIFRPRHCPAFELVP